MVFSATTGADFLKLPKSARAIGLGDSYAAILGDVTAMEYNPAAMNTIKNLAFSMMYQMWFDNVFSIYASGAFKVYDFVLGMSAFYVDYGGVKEYDAFGALVYEHRPHDLNIKFAVAVDGGILLPALTGLSLGVSLSILERTLIDEMKMGFSFDIGLNYQWYMGQVPLFTGLSVKNLGAADESITPVQATLGFAIKPSDNFLISLDTSYEQHNNLIFR
jgi:hypothetical protein